MKISSTRQACRVKVKDGSDVFFLMVKVTSGIEIWVLPEMPTDDTEPEQAKAILHLDMETSFDTNRLLARIWDEQTEKGSNATHILTLFEEQRKTSSDQSEAKVALERCLHHLRFPRTLCLSYEAKKRGRSCLYLVPDGVGAWTWAETDTHPLSLPVPSISADEYLLLIHLAQGSISNLLDHARSEVLQAWAGVALRADEPERPFYNPTAS